MKPRKPPVPFAAPGQFWTLEPGTEIYHVFHRSRGAAEFNPSPTFVCRWRPFRDSAGVVVPTYFGATTARGALLEAVFPPVSPKAKFAAVPLAAVKDRVLACLRVARPLELVNLSAACLRPYGVQRGDLLDPATHASYVRTAAWSMAFWNAAPDSHGLRWSSRRDDEPGNHSFMLFGDRANSTDLELIAEDPLDVSANGLRRVLSTARLLRTSTADLRPLATALGLAWP